MDEMDNIMIEIEKTISTREFLYPFTLIFCVIAVSSWYYDSPNLASFLSALTCVLALYLLVLRMRLNNLANKAQNIYYKNIKNISENSNDTKKE